MPDWSDTVFLLYDLLLMFCAAVLVPYYLLRGLRHGKLRRGIRERLGYYDPGKLARLRGRRVIWVHAVSVGESRAALPLLRALKRAYPDAALVLTNVTETGREIAQSIEEVDLCLFFPFDLTWVVKRVLSLLRPSLIVIVETEIWPNLVRLAGRQKIPLVLVNGRLSDRSFPRYRLLHRLLEPLLANFSALCMQTEQDAERMRAIGGPPQRVSVTGNLKFDMQVPQFRGESPAQLRQAYRLRSEPSVLVAGSTHAGEEEIVLELYRRLLAKGRDLQLVLVPRHPERCRTVGEMLEGEGIAYELRSRLESRRRPLAEGEVLLVDTVGELMRFYALSDLVFVGGSFVEVGGHNVLEASLLHKAVLFGPHMHNFREISHLVLDAGGGVQVRDPEELLRQIDSLLDDPQRRRRMGENGYRLPQQHTGATERTLSTLSPLMEGADERP